MSSEDHPQLFLKAAVLAGAHNGWCLRNFCLTQTSRKLAQDSLTWSSCVAGIMFALAHAVVLHAQQPCLQILQGDVYQERLCYQAQFEVCQD